MKRKILALAAFLLAACGDETTEVTQINQAGIEVVSSVGDLPDCTEENEGEQALVKGESSVRVCVDSKWFATTESSIDTVYMNNGVFSCTTKELADKSGLKIICNGDSIGVILNGVDGKDGKPGETGKDGNEGKKGDTGADGEDGKDGAGCSISARTETTVSITCGDSVIVIDLGVHSEASTDTVELDSEKIVTNLESLDGYTQKGPFLKGSTVYLYELSDGRTLRQTNGNFMSYITSDDGRYQFNARNLVSQYAMVVVDGYYRNEVTGKISDAPIRLRAITEMTERSSANVNLLTNLEFDRVYYLVTQKKMKVRNAKKQAQAEIFKAFHIDTTGFKGSSEDLDVFGTSDADAALLAISILLQGDSDETALSVLLTEISNDMATDGKWDGPNSDSIKAAIADWAATADSTQQDTASRLFKFRGNVSGWGLGDGTVPAFEKFIRKFWSVENGLGVCGEGDNGVGVVKHVSNEKSRQYYTAAYDDAEKVDVRFICADAGKARWRAATDIEKDTMGLGQEGYKAGEFKYGKINKDLIYVFEDDKWRFGTYLDTALEQTCLKNSGVSKRTYENDYYECKEAASGDTARFWVKAGEVLNNTHEYESRCYYHGRYGDGRLLPGRINKNSYYVCDGYKTFREASSNEINYGLGCTEHNPDALVYWNGKRYKCRASGWVATADSNGVLYDYRDGKEYPTVAIGSQVWMAKNLDYNVSVSYCYKNSADSCERFGRLYTWPTAVDKPEAECGTGKTCILSGTVRGICPEGWHLPDTTEFNTLITTAGGLKEAASSLVAKRGWLWNGNGSDKFGFSALPAGYLFSDDYFLGWGYYTGFWTSTEKYSYGFNADGKGYIEEVVLKKGCMGSTCSVRCLMDKFVAQ